jgi:hypothetical protein
MAWDDLLSHSEQILANITQPEIQATITAAANTRQELDLNIQDMFPSAQEIEILSNGITSVKVSEGDAMHAGVVSHTWDEWFDMYAQVKASAPDKPVYMIHNHPAYDAQTFQQNEHRDTLNPEVHGIVGATPSIGDVEAWSDFTALFTPAIYHQREDVFAAYMENPDVAHSTHVLLEHVPEENHWLLGYVPEHYRVYLAAEGDIGNPDNGDISVEFADWPRVKEQYGDKLSFLTLQERSNHGKI